MRFEVIKSYILTILVGLSLLLTFSLWNYQPGYELLSDSNYLDEIDLGGRKQSKKEIIEPSTMVFQNHGKYYGFSNPQKRQLLYHEMQSWPFYDFRTSEANGQPRNYHVEIVFPDELPMELVSSLFTMNEEVELPSWSFQRMYLSLDPSRSLINIQFLSVDGRQQAKAVVNNVSKFEILRKQISEVEGLAEYIKLDDTDKPIFIPKDPVHMIQRSFSIHTLDPNMLVDALFSSPSSVRTNISNVNEVYYTDGQRGMTFLNNKRRMEYFNPNLTRERMDPVNLVERSIMDINEYKGWTGEYNLESLDPFASRVRYQMYYEGYPVYNKDQLAIIEQEWRNQDLHRYIRPLFGINNIYGGNQVELPSGQDVQSYLKNKSSYDLEKIADIQVGYRLHFQDSSSYILTLEPEWYMLYNNSWIEINMDEDIQEKGVS